MSELVTLRDRPTLTLEGLHEQIGRGQQGNTTYKISDYQSSAHSSLRDSKFCHFSLFQVCSNLLPPLGRASFDLSGII